ncbi:hypothetical protein B9Z55_002954 [Caenorhabditis nigoni]|uniref:Uncharacterized protein n=2 Tax=Caenorhabditis nigoni TaxID=1611254 RepID=A0A2G5VNA2_9PELO|nr:hypothetical protein B9Z55_002954 [Caenorhabditis nigoni]
MTKSLEFDYTSSRAMPLKLGKDQMAATSLEALAGLTIALGALIAIIAIRFLLDFLYNWWCSRRVGEVTTTPWIPEDHGNFSYFTNSMRIYCRWTSDVNRCTEKLNSLVDANERAIPENARIISVRMDGFEHGELCHEFVPTVGVSSGSYYTWQMFGDNRIQVTNYVENGVSYVAGYCIYIESAKLRAVNFRGEVVEKLKSSRKYPGNKRKEMETGFSVVPLV